MRIKRNDDSTLRPGVAIGGRGEHLRLTLSLPGADFTASLTCLFSGIDAGGA